VYKNKQFGLGQLIVPMAHSMGKESWRINHQLVGKLYNHIENCLMWVWLALFIMNRYYYAWGAAKSHAGTMVSLPLVIHPSP